MSHRRSFTYLLVGAVLNVVGALTTSELLTVDEVDQCPRPDTFRASIIVEHELLAKKWTAPSELELLGETFRDTYNTMNAPRPESEVCDRVFNRAATSVTVEPMPMLYRQYPDQEGYRRQFVYHVEGSCTGCAIDTSLFDKGKARSGSALNQLAQEATACSCASSADSSNDRGPTESEFKKAFKSVVRKMGGGDSTALNNADAPERVVEVEGGRCKDADSFESQVSIELSTEPSATDLVAVQDSFVNAYNFLTPVYCDPQHHLIQSLNLGSSRRNLRRKLGRLFDGNVRGRCRGCNSEKGPYDNGNRRLDEQRRTEEPPECYCSKHPKGYRPPTLQEYTNVFNKTLIAAYKDGYLTEQIFCMGISDNSATAG